MGRVYKALAKNWQESQSQKPERMPADNNPADASVGRGESIGAASEASRFGATSPRSARQNDANIEVGIDAGFDDAQGSDVADQERVIEFFNPSKTVEEGLEALRAPGLSEMQFTTQQGREWNDAGPRLQLAPASAPSPLHEQKPAAAPPPALPPFVEPQAILDIGRLNVEPHLVALNKSDRLAAERYRTLAVRLLNLASRQADKKVKTLLVTSAKEGEGKTTVAANLAWVMAKSPERRVLLIDADVQKPGVCQKLNVQTRHGWLDLIDGKAKFVDAALRLDPSGLYVMSPRQSAAEYAPAADSLTSSRVDRLFKELEQYFDFILIDAPAILDSADAQRIASIVDGTVLVTRAGQTHHMAVTEALKLIPKERRLGVVLNEAEKK